MSQFVSLLTLPLPIVSVFTIYRGLIIACTQELNTGQFLDCNLLVFDMLFATHLLLYPKSDLTDMSPPADDSIQYKLCTLQ